MAWIKTIDETEAAGKLREDYERMKDPSSGGVDNILKIHSLNRPSLRAHFDFYKIVMRGRSPLSRAQREMIGVVSSALNQCHY